MSSNDIVSELVDRVSRELEARIRSLKHLSLSDVASILEEVLCRNWGRVRSVYEKVKVLSECSVTVEDSEAYLDYAMEEARRASNRLVDLAMEALAKHVESLPEGLYSRLSWLLVSHSARTANRIQRLASLMREKPGVAPLAELSILLIAVRAAALYRLVTRLEADTLKTLIEHIEAFIAACDLEEDSLIDKLEKGAVATIMSRNRG